MLIAHLQHERLLKDKLTAHGPDTRHGFNVYNEVIATPGDGLITFTCMQDHKAESIKSLEGYGRAWVEGAQTLSEL
jgi:phage terminase large subunit